MERYHEILPTAKDMVESLFDVLEPKVIKSQKVARFVLENVEDNIECYGEISDSLLSGQWGGHPRDRIALYPRETEY